MNMFTNDFIEEIRSMTPQERQDSIEQHTAVMVELADVIEDAARVAAMAMRRSAQRADMQNWESVREWKQKYMYIPKLIERLMSTSQLVVELRWCQEDLGETLMPGEWQPGDDMSDLETEHAGLLEYVRSDNEQYEIEKQHVAKRIANQRKRGLITDDEAKAELLAIGIRMAEGFDPNNTEVTQIIGERTEPREEPIVELLKATTKGKKK